MENTQTNPLAVVEQKVALPQNQIQQGSKSQNHIREVLSNKQDADATFPWLTTGDFLSGSYARNTKNPPLDDIDIMVVVDGTGLCAIRNGIRLNAQVRGAGKYGSPITQYTDKNGYIDSAKILEAFRNTLRETYPDSEIRKDGQAVNVWLESYGMGLDIVPCFHIVPTDGSRDHYYIPAGYGNPAWLPTNPKIDAEICDWLDKAHGGKLKPLIKILKHWNEVCNNSAIKPYHLEAVTWYVFAQQGAQITSLSQAFNYFFTHAPTYLASRCSDPTGLGGHIDYYLTQTNRLLALQNMQRTKQLVELAQTYSALRLESRAQATWNQVFKPTA